MTRRILRKIDDDQNSDDWGLNYPLLDLSRTLPALRARRVATISQIAEDTGQSYLQSSRDLNRLAEWKIALKLPYELVKGTDLDPLPKKRKRKGRKPTHAYVWMSTHDEEMITKIKKLCFKKLLKKEVRDNILRSLNEIEALPE